MAHSKTLLPGLLAGIAAAAAVFTMLVDPAPTARGEPTQPAGMETPHGLRDRSADTAARLRVIDGDTMEDMREDIIYRVVNIDTPETGSRARCAAERALGDQATQAARSMIADAREWEFRPTGRIDDYGRTIAFLMLDGRDFGETLIGEGLARPWRGRREPWCDGAGNLIP